MKQSTFIHGGAAVRRHESLGSVCRCAGVSGVAADAFVVAEGKIFVEIQYFWNYKIFGADVGYSGKL